MATTGMFLNAEENKKFWAIAERGNFGFAAWDKQGKFENDATWIDRHIQKIISLPYINLEAVRSKKFKVVVDCDNAAGCVIVPKLLRQFECRIIPLNCELTGIFSHTPEPIPENLTQLAAKVVEEKADLGIAVDPDVDRLVLINEKGEPFVEEYTIASAVNFVLKKEMELGKKDQRVVVNLSTTRAVDDIATKFGASVARTPVGEINVAAKMKEIGAVVGGEGSGGVILREVHLGRDAMVGIGLFLQFLTEFGGKTSELKASLPQYTIVKNKIELGTLQPDIILKKLNEKYSRTEKANSDDGLKIDFASSWVHLRKSNTEPIIRIIAEAKTRDEASSLVERFKKEILA